MSTASAAPSEQMSFRQWLATFGSMLGAFMAILDIQITNAALRDVTGGLGATIEDGSWISTSYLVAEIVIIPLSGWLTQVLSLRRYLIWTAGLFLFFSMCCGLAWNLPSMIIFRACQGLTGGALIPLAFQVILGLSPSQRPLGQALFGITATFAPSIGPTIGGYLTEIFHWPAIFYINVVPGAIMLWALSKGLDSQPGKKELLAKADVPGILAMALGLSSLTVFLEEGERKDWFASRMIISLGLSALVFLFCFVWIELKSKNPFINLRLIKDVYFGLGTAINFVVGLALYGAVFILPLYLSTIQGYNAIQIGKTMMWVGLPQLFIFPLLPRLMKTVDLRKMAFVGLNIFALSCYMNSSMTADFGYDQLMWSQIVRALGQPMVMIPLSMIATGMVAKDQAGSASGLFNMLRNLGGSVGIAILSTVFTLREQFHSNRVTDAVSLYSAATQERVAAMTAKFVGDGFDSHLAQEKAYQAIGYVVRREATMMSFNDCFLVIALALSGCSLLLFFCKRVDPAKAAGGGH